MQLSFSFTSEFYFCDKLLRFFSSKTCKTPWLGGLVGWSIILPGVSNLQPRMAMTTAQHKIINLLKIFFCSSVFFSVCVFNVWPKTTLLLPVCPRDTKKLDTPEGCRFDPKLGHVQEAYNQCFSITLILSLSPPPSSLSKISKKYILG